MYQCMRCHKMFKELPDPDSRYTHTCPDCGGVVPCKVATNVIIKNAHLWYTDGVDKPIFDDRYVDKSNKNDKGRAAIIAEPNKEHYATASERKHKGIKIYGGK